MPSEGKPHDRGGARSAASPYRRRAGAPGGPEAAPAPDLASADAFVWHAEGGLPTPVSEVNHVALPLLRGIDHVTGILLENTRRFAEGLPANNALLWGARGMGKSSLVKAIHAHIAAERPGALALVEIHREDIGSLPSLLALLRDAGRRFVLFCDDLSFDGSDTTYKSLKAVLEGGLEGRPENVVFYATSNRRHMMPRDMIEKRTLDGHQSGGGGRGEGLAVGPVRPLARLSQLQPGDLF